MLQWQRLSHRISSRRTVAVVHTINQVLLPKWTNTSLFDLVEELRGQRYDTVIGILDKLNLTSDLSAGQSLTLFAPSDLAFENAPDEIKKYLEDTEAYSSEITQLLTSHVSLGRLYSTANLTSETVIHADIQWQLARDH